MTPTPDEARVLLPFRKTKTPSGQPLRVGVVLDGAPTPRWVESLIAFLREFPGIEVHPFTFGVRRSTQTWPPWLVDRLYSASRRKFDPFSEPAGKSEKAPPVASVVSSK
jgi:hypothetical protein